MRKTLVWITLCFCLFAVAIAASAQAIRKPGLWEMTTTMTWQKSPMPPGMTMPPGMKSPFSGSTITSQVCLTQAMIDKYGAPISQNKDCQIVNISMKASGMTAEMVCSGKMNGKGTMMSTWPDGNHAKGKVHFEGTMQAGPNPMPVEWTADTTSTFKGPDCGSVKPLPMPSN
ncbi:MAG: DUF3617 family protein [Terracidiphilus sp.]|jgi:hypothetical protein